MKKSCVPRLPAAVLWALAAGAGGMAHAQSTVQVYGLLDMGVGSFRDSGGGRSDQVTSGKLTTSYLGFKGSEDLGGGLLAFFAIESHLRLDTGEFGRNATDPFFSRNAFVGLKTGVGSFSLGRVNTPLWIAALGSNPFGSSTGYSPILRSLYGPTGKTGGDAVWNNSLVYQSPVIGGFSTMLQHQLKEAAQGGNTGGHLLFNSGALSLTAAAQQVEVPYTRGKETTALLGGSYDFGPAKLFAQYARVREGATASATAALATANTRDKIYQVGASVKAGATGAVLVSFAQAKTEGAQAGKREFFSLGYDYRLSRRTDIYAVAMTDKFNALSRGNSVGVGIRHVF